MHQAPSTVIMHNQLKALHYLDLIFYKT